MDAGHVDYYSTVVVEERGVPGTHDSRTDRLQRREGFGCEIVEYELGWLP
jgi:hypothetical protein